MPYTGPDHVFNRAPARQLPVVAHGEGVYLYDEQGRRYLDGCSGALVTNIGHGDARVAEVLHQQARQVAYVHGTQFTSPPAQELAGALARLLPDPLNRVYFVSGGSEAVETAIKLARQYFVERGEYGRHKVVSRRPSYHGGTLGALSLTGRRPNRAPFAPLLHNWPKVSVPHCTRCPLGHIYPACGISCAAEIEQVIRYEGPDQVAAVILEPVSGSAIPGVVPPPGYLETVRGICDRYGVLLVYDEIMTGFGRTGRWFAMEHTGVTPDLVALGKGMGSGYIPLGAVVAREAVHDTIRRGSGVFVHGYTYQGNPLACAVGRKIIDIIESDGLVDNAAVRGEELGQRLRGLAPRLPLVGEVRGAGLLWGMELVADQAEGTPFPPSLGVAAQVARQAFANGLIVYPGTAAHDGVRGDHLTIAPPLITAAAQVDELVNLLASTLAQVADGLPA